MALNGLYCADVQQLFSRVVLFLTSSEQRQISGTAV